VGQEWMVGQEGLKRERNHVAALVCALAVCCSLSHSRERDSSRMFPMNQEVLME
jgi:hypothetical protein